MVTVPSLLTPLGLLALSSLGVLIVLYLVSRRPTTVQLPTLTFLERDPKRSGSRPRLSRLRRALLFLLQALVLIACALALATPYLALPPAGSDEVALVVDASASMATEADGSTRFDRALTAAEADVAATTSLILARPSPAVEARRVSGGRARSALETAVASDAPGDLAGAIGLAATTAADGVAVHVYSDFADATDWRGAIERARARGVRVVLHQFDGGGATNVGIVETTFDRTDVTATIRNTGSRTAQRRVSLGDQQRTVTLDPGDVRTLRFPVPAGGGRLRLDPRDEFAVDDVVPIGAPAEGRVRVLVLQSEPDRYLLTALDLVEAFDVRVERLPASVSGAYDVVVFGTVDSEDVLAGNLALARATLQSGGGVIVTGQPGLPSVGFGDLLLVDPRGVATSTAEPTVVEEPLTTGVTFPPPGEFVTATRRAGTVLVRAGDGSPLVAVGETGGGQLLYYGYSDEGQFPFEATYPVFWKRAIYHVAGRPSLASLNRRTGERLTFQAVTTVQTPSGRTSGRTVPLQQVGFYEYADRRVGVGLLDGRESVVQADPIDAGTGGGGTIVGEQAGGASGILSLVPVAVALAILGLAGELAILRYRGEI